MTYPFDKVLVTGGAGFIGSQLVKKLLPLSRSIIVIDDCSTGADENVPVSDAITFVKASYLDERLLRDVLPGCTHIFHLACRNLVLSATNLIDDFNVNLFGGCLLLRLAHELCPDLQRFLYTSTASIYGNADSFPTTEDRYRISVPYAASKFSMEHYCQMYVEMYGMPIAVLRLSNVYGPGQVTTNPYCGVVAKFFEAAGTGQPFRVYGDGSQTRDYTYVEDVMEALVLAAMRPEAVGLPMNIGTSIETSVNELAELIARIEGIAAPKIEYVPKRKVDVVSRRSLAIERVRSALGWAPKHLLHEGLAKTGEWRKEESGQ